MTDAVRVENFVEGSLREGWNLFKEDWVLYVIAGLVVAVASFLSLGLLAGPLVVGFIKLVEKRMQGESGTATDVFAGFSRFGASLIAMILIGIGVFVGCLLLVLPGLLFAIVTAFTFHAIALDDASATEAIGKSYSLIKDNPGPSLVLLLVVFVINAAGGAIVLGALLTTPLALIVMTVGYRRLTGAKLVLDAEPISQV